MEHSSEINELAMALAKAQSELKNPKKDTKGHNYKYATLDGCMDVLKEVLPKNGLSISQPVSVQNQQLGVTTILMHSSGQYIKSFIPLETGSAQRMSEMQKMGSAITYARRYSLGIVGITPEEDDDAAPNRQQVQRPMMGPQMITSAQLGTLRAKYQQLGQEEFAQTSGLKDPSQITQLTSVQADKILAKFREGE